MNKFIFALAVFILVPKFAISQFNEKEIGAWYMYFFSGTVNESRWGFQGDFQYRNWNIAGDLEQLLLRGGLTFKPKRTDIKFTAGIAHISSGDYGVSEDYYAGEKRVYQEAIFPTKVGKRFYFHHRIRYEQRFVEHQNFRTRYRYNLFLNVPLNKSELEKNAVYLAFYNELFMNGERTIGNGKTVEIFDRNRFYVAIGYVVSNKLKIQVGALNQTTDIWSKNQLQIGFHHTF